MILKKASFNLSKKPIGSNALAQSALQAPFDSVVVVVHLWRHTLLIPERPSFKSVRSPGTDFFLRNPVAPRSSLETESNNYFR